MELVRNGKYSSLYLVEQINIFRNEEGNRAKIRHSDLLRKIEKEFEEEITERNISVSYYKDKSGKQSKYYDLDYKQSVQILVSESKVVRKAVIRRLEELEAALKSKDNIANTKKHLKRYEVNKKNIPNGYFSMIEEAIFHVILPLELDGKDLIDKCLPDGSLGKGFCSFLKSKGFDTTKLPTYKHHFEDGRVVNANLYPDEFLQFFKQYLRAWVDGNGKKYFQDRVKRLGN